MDTFKYLNFKHSDTYGTGVFGRENIPKGTYILRESPLFRGPKDFLGREVEFQLLSDEDKAAFRNLHQICRCTSAVCIQTVQEKVRDGNAFEINSKLKQYAKSAVYAKASLFNHSCAPDAWWSINHKE
ncbi:hypothetical protein B0J14DRAFT_649775 [Halenospora varia]|nr:hypothetical protein B0J14DRAFT_649775 [Halenospora varia]